MTHYDAYGRNTSELGICARCGASIKYIYTHNGQTYGSECIEVVTGIGKNDQVFNGRELDVNASNAKIQARKDLAARNEALDAKREDIRQSNQVKFAEVINLLNNVSKYEGDFCSSIARQIGNDGFSSELSDILSDRAFQIVRDIWGKTIGGRVNSKAFNTAVAEFDTKFNFLP